MYHPELYDLVTPASFRGDTEWYVARARDAGGPILELGAGTGRITLQIAQAGGRIHALDADPAMLDRLQQKLTSLPPDVRERVSTTVGDMRSFALAERFALAVAPFRAFLHNLTEQDQLAWAWAAPKKSRRSSKAKACTGGVGAHRRCVR